MIKRKGRSGFARTSTCEHRPKMVRRGCLMAGGGDAHSDSSAPKVIGDGGVSGGMLRRGIL